MTVRLARIGGVAVDDRTVERLLIALHSGQDLQRAAVVCELSLAEVARWGSTSAGGAAISSLQRLAQARSALAVARAKAEAAQALLELAQDEESKETARKACVDLLNLDDAPVMAMAADESIELSSEEQRAWLAALERLGSENGAPPLSRTDS